MNGNGDSDDMTAVTSVMQKHCVGYTLVQLLGVEAREPYISDDKD